MQGEPPECVRRLLKDGVALSETYGFAGELDDALVRDVLGRYPLFTELDDPRRQSDQTTPVRPAVPMWSSDPTELESPSSVPAGHRRTADGDERIWALPEPTPYENDDRAIAALREAIVDAVDGVADTSVDAIDGATQTAAVDDPAVAFSGGLDSSILAARLDGSLYVGGFEGSHDIAAARTAAAALDRDLRVVEFSHADLERVVPEIVRATGRSNAMDVQIALPLFLVAERVAADGHDCLALGQGADELFGGYAKVAKAPTDHRLAADTISEAVREVVATLPEQLERDVLTVRAAGVEPVVPLLYDRVVAVALRLPEHLLVDGTERKVALRRAADFLPDSIRSREKKAVQYGSLTARELDRLARRAGFKRRMDDHVGRYVDSLCE